MKKSQAAILAAAGLIAIIMLIVIGLGRLAVGKAVEYKSSESNTGGSSSDADTSKSLDFNGFDSVVVEGAWTVRINRSDDFSTKIRYPFNYGKQDSCTCPGKSTGAGDSGLKRPFTRGPDC